MYRQALEGIGLTQGEIKVYSALIQLGESTTGKIIQESKLSSGKIYEILDKLIDKGFVNYIVKNKTKYFSATNPKKILEYVEGKKEEIDNKKKDVEKAMPELFKLYNLKKQDYKAVIYKGYEGIKTAIFESLDELSQGDTWHSMGASSNREDKILWMWHRFEKLRLKNKVNIKLIASKEDDLKDYMGVGLMKIRLLDIGGKVPVDIAGDNVLIYNFEDLSVIRITSFDVANSFRDFFEHLWMISKEV